MEFTADQYFAAAVTCVMGLAIMAAGYILGRKDGNDRAEIYRIRSEKTHSLPTQLAALQSSANRLRAEKNALQRQAAELSERITELDESGKRLKESLDWQREGKRKLRIKYTGLKHKVSKQVQQIETLRQASITPDQHGQITRAAYQLELAAQLMDAMHNDAAAKTQRLLASQLRDIAAPNNITEAAA